MRRQYDLICFDCGDSFTAFSKKALRCPTCRKEHAREKHKAFAENKRKLQKRGQPSWDWYYAIADIEAKAYALKTSYGKYVAYRM